MFLSPSASFTYSTKSRELGSRASWVRRSSTRSAELAGTKCTRSPSSVAAGSPSRSCSTIARRSRRERLLDDLARERDPARLGIGAEPDLAQALQGVRVLDQHTGPLEHR